MKNGHGAGIVQDPVESVESRDWFYEPHGRRYYFRAPDFIMIGTMAMFWCVERVSGFWD